MPGLPNGTDMEVIFHIHSHKSSLACTWKPSSEIWTTRAYSNHHRRRLEAPTPSEVWNLHRKMELSQSLPSRGGRNTWRGTTQTKPCTKHGAMVSYCCFLEIYFLSFFNCGCDWVCVCAQVLSETTGVLSPGAAVRGSYELDNVSTGNWTQIPAITAATLNRQTISSRFLTVSF